MQSWTQNGTRAYWAVNVKPEVFAHVSDGMTTRSPRRTRRLEALHEDERKRVRKDKDVYDALDTGVYDESLVGNWMRRTDWVAMFSGVNRRLLVRLTQAPAANGSALVYGSFYGMHLHSGAEDERRIRTIGAAMDRFFDRCEDTVSHTGHSIRCWLRSHLADRPYKAPFQLPFRPGTRSRYRGLWRGLLYFCFRLYRLDSTVRRNILRYELTDEQRIALDEVWGDACWAARPAGGYYNDDVEGEAELELSTRCSSMSSQSSWSAESANLSTSVGDSESMRHRKTKMGPASPCKVFKEAARTVNELVEDEEFIDLGLDDWPMCEASDDSLECLSPRTIKIVNDGKGKEITSSRDENSDDTVQEKMADIVGNLSYSLCCEEL